MLHQNRSREDCLGFTKNQLVFFSRKPCLNWRFIWSQTRGTRNKQTLQKFACNSNMLQVSRLSSVVILIFKKSKHCFIHGASDLWICTSTQMGQNFLIFPNSSTKQAATVHNATVFSPTKSGSCSYGLLVSSTAADSCTSVHCGFPAMFSKCGPPNVVLKRYQKFHDLKQRYEAKRMGI